MNDDFTLGVFKTKLILLATLVCAATGVFAHRGVRAVHRFIVLRAAVARADLVAALRHLALAILTFLLVGRVDQSVTVRTVVGVAVDCLQGMDP